MTDAEVDTYVLVEDVGTTSKTFPGFAEVWTGLFP